MSALRGKICRRQIRFFGRNERPSAVSASAACADGCSALPFGREKAAERAFLLR